MNPASNSDSLAELNRLLAQISREGHVDMTVGGLHRAVDSDCATIEILVRDTEGTLLTELRIVLDGVLEFAIDQDEFGMLEVAAPGHPLLWPYVEPGAELYFYTPADDVGHVIACLYEAHTDVVDGWYSLGRFTNKLLPLHQLLASPRGLLASGPLPLIVGYEVILKDAGVECSVLNSGVRRWPVLRRPDPEGSQPVALLMGTSYVIARSLASVESRAVNIAFTEDDNNPVTVD